MSQQINLLDPSLLPQRRWLSGQRVMAFAALLSLGVTAHALYEGLALRRINAVNAASASALPADASPASDELTQQMQALELQLARNRSLLHAVSDLTDLPRDTSRRLQALVAALPDNAWLREVDFSGAQGLRIVGGALDSSALATYSRRLGASPDFQGLPLRAFSLAPSAQNPDADPDAPPSPEADPAPSPAPAATTAPRRLAQQPPQFGFVLSSADAGGHQDSAP